MIDTKDAALEPLAYQQIIALVFATGLTVPDHASKALIAPEVANVRWRDDDTPPTATIGMRLIRNSTMTYIGDLRKLKFIQESAGAKLNVAYYR